MRVVSVVHFLRFSIDRSVLSNSEHEARCRLPTPIFARAHAHAHADISSAHCRYDDDEEALRKVRYKSVWINATHPCFGSPALTAPYWETATGAEEAVDQGWVGFVFHRHDCPRSPPPNQHL